MAAATTAQRGGTNTGMHCDKVVAIIITGAGASVYGLQEVAVTIMSYVSNLADLAKCTAVCQAWLTASKQPKLIVNVCGFGHFSTICNRYD